MTGCSAHGCTKRTSGKTRTQNHSFFKFPEKDVGRRRVWVHKVGVANWKPTKSSRLCECHFEDSMFEKDLQLAITGKPLKKGKHLVEDAIPSKFTLDGSGQWHVGPPVSASQLASLPPVQPPTTKTGSRAHTVDRIRRMEQKRLVEELLSEKSSAATPPKVAKMSIINHGHQTGTQNDMVPVVADTAEESSNRLLNEVPVVAATCEPSISQVYPAVYGHLGVVMKDHAYAPDPGRQKTRKKSAPPIPQQASTEPDVPIIRHPSLSESDEECTHISSEQAQSDSDIYSPHSSEIDSDPDDILDDEYLSPGSEATHIVFDSNLRQLMKMCQTCGKPVIEIKKKEEGTGSLVTYELSCLDGHTITWRSQPMVRQMALGNLMLAAAVLFTGLTYARLATFAKAMNLSIFAKDTFNSIQREKLFPVIKDAWVEQKASLLSERSDSAVSVSGDSRADSPGHNAKYGTYTLMENTGCADGVEKILNVQLVQCTEVKNSNQMEPEGLRRALDDMNSEGVQIESLATDRHMQVRKIMRTEYAEINHDFDVWHVGKSVVKKLNKKAASKKNADLLPWIQAVSNHFWWCCATCNGDEEQLRERWISILHHVTNKHRWTDSVKFKKCAHRPLRRREERKKAWLKPDSSAFQALQDVVLDKYLLDSLPNLVHFQHTGELEVFHNQLLKYCPKRQHFGYRGMTARTMLAVLDWNSTLRETVLNDDGSPKFDQVFSKRRKTWVLRKRYKRINSRHIEGLMQKTIHTHKHKIVLPPIESPPLPANIARVDKPNKEEAVAHHKTRFRKK